MQADVTYGIFPASPEEYVVERLLDGDLEEPCGLSAPVAVYRRRAAAERQARMLAAKARFDARGYDTPA